MVGVIIQARMSSTRLPNKVLKKLAGKEVLLRVVDRCRRCKTVNKVIVATSTDKSDDKIYDFCNKKNIDVVRGSLNNVLARFYKSAKKHKLDCIVRITADCPLIEPTIIDNCVELYLKNKKKIDYVSNSLYRIFPRGLDVEVFSFKSLERAYLNVKTKSEKEHVTPYIIEHEKKMGYKVQKKYRSNLRLTLDTKKDYKLLSYIYNKFYKPGEIIDTVGVIKYLNKHPKITNINRQEDQKNIKAVVVLGGGIKKDEKTGIWRTTNFNEEVYNFGVFGDRIRVVAGALDYFNNPTNTVLVASGGLGQLEGIPGAKKLADVIEYELIGLGVPINKIIKESKAGSTYSQLKELKKIIKKMKFEQVEIISNDYHLPRIRVMIEYDPELKEFYKLAKIKLVAAEKIALKFEKKKWEKIIKKAYSSEGMNERIKLEKKGVRQIKDGTYKFR